MKNILTAFNLTIICLLFLISHGSAAAQSVLSKDIFFGNWSPWKTNWEISLPVCVPGPSSKSFFTVTASGQYAGTEYAVSNDLADKVSYEVYWHYGQGATKSELLRSGIQSTRVFQYNQSKKCENGVGNRLRVKLDKAQIDQAIAGIYNDTLLLVLTPL